MDVPFRFVLSLQITKQVYMWILAVSANKVSKKNTVKTSIM